MNPGVLGIGISVEPGPPDLSGLGARLDFSETFAGGVEGTLPIGRRVHAFAPKGGRAPRVLAPLGRDET